MISTDQKKRTFQFTVTVAVEDGSLGNLVHQCAVEFVRAMRAAAPAGVHDLPVVHGFGPRPTPTKAAGAAEALLWNNREVAKALRVSEKTLWSLRQDRKVPPSIRFRGSLRWSAAEIREWIAAGCPEQSVWQKIRHPQMPLTQ